MTLDKKVEKKVARLLALVVEPDVDPDSYEFVLGKLTNMVVLGEAPASGLADTGSAKAKHESYDFKDDPRSASKENWIAR